MLATKRPLWSVQEGDKQRIFAFGQCDDRAGWIRELSGAQIQPPAGKPIAAAFWLACGGGSGPVEPPNDRAQPRQKLTQVKGLRHIVVGAELKTDHTVDLIPAVACDDNHRDIGTRSELSQQVEPVLESEPKI